VTYQGELPTKTQLLDARPEELTDALDAADAKAGKEEADLAMELGETHSKDTDVDASYTHGMS